jgi:predicted nucleic acid-binding protein/GNAT superfamily N-acetyltransferase
VVTDLSGEANDGLAVRILCSPADVVFFVPEVRHYADTDKDALGFLPASVYDEAAQSGNLLIAVASREGLNVYAGHLLFGGRFPHAKIYQIFVAPPFREKGVARTLIAKLVDITEGCSYLSIAARVAAELPVNAFWEGMSFSITGVRAGGFSRKRIINLRVRQLNTRTLFSPIADYAQDLGLVDRLAIREPVFVIDLNVFWDVVRQRPRSSYAAEVVAAAFHQLVHVVVTSEFVKELGRTSRPDPTDPALEFAMQLPVLPEPDSVKLSLLVEGLSRIVFPAQVRDGVLSVQDRSDLVHLAIAVHHSANAFVTAENAMLQARDVIYDRYGVEVLHVEKLAEALKNAQRLIPTFRARLSSDTVNLWELVSGNSSQVESFLKCNSAPAEYREDFLSAGRIGSDRKRLAVTSEMQMVCLASWDITAGLQRRANVRLIADEEHPAAETVLNCIIGKVCAEASRGGPVLLRLSTPVGHVVSKKIALLHGFRPPEFPEAGGEMFLQKVSVGRPVVASNWSRVRKTVQECSGLALPDAFPRSEGDETSISFVTAAGTPGAISLPRLEKLLSPTIFIGEGRIGCIAPIRRVYSEQLLQASAQMSLEPNREAALFSERVYFSSCRNLRVLPSNTALLFYESGGGGGRAAVIAVARVLTTEVHTKKALSAERLRHGVLDSDDLLELTASESVAVTTFDSVMTLDQPVRLDRLRRLGCVDGANLVSARQLSYEQLVAVVQEGFPLG